MDSIKQIPNRLKHSIESMPMSITPNFIKKHFRLKSFLRQRHPIPELYPEITPETLKRCNKQTQSPLFGLLPAEIRNDIFFLSTQTYEDPRPEHQYKDTEYFYRPGHRARRRTDSALPQTCRLAWLETNALPLLQAEPTFWFEDAGRGPPHRTALGNSSSKVPSTLVRLGSKEEAEMRFESFFHALTTNNSRNLVRMKIFSQLYFLEGNYLCSLFERTFTPRRPAPNLVTITIRHADWWWWENNTPLRLEHAWIWKLLASPSFAGVGVLAMELETVGENVGQLMRVLDELKFVCGVVGEFKLDLEGAGRHVCTWTGPDLGPKTPAGEIREVKMLEYHVYGVEWRREKSS